jgi:hypothetical protein
VKNDDGGAAPTRKGTNWVVRGWAAEALGGGDRNDCSSRSVCGNGFWSSSVELSVGAHVVSWQTGNHIQEKWVERAAGPEVAAVGSAENPRVLVRREHCGIVKKGREGGCRSFGEVVARSASISSGERQEGGYASLGGQRTSRDLWGTAGLGSFLDGWQSGVREG